MFNRVQGSDSFPDGTHRSEFSGAIPLELQELLQEQQPTKVTPAAECSEWPVSVHVPERYEENYAYPLIVWFHDDGEHEGQLEPVMQAISPQNYCGLGIQGNHTLVADCEFAWSQERLDYSAVPLHDLLSVTVRRLRQAFHIHSERIFLAGAGTGADVALQQLCQVPEWYAGAVLLNPACGTKALDALESATLRDKSLLWTVSESASNEQLADNVEAVQLLRMSGAQPEVRVTNTAIDPESSDVRFVDHWLLSKFGSEAFI